MRIILSRLTHRYSLINIVCSQILHMHIGSLDKLPLTTTGSPLLIRCKTFLFVTFVIPREKECHDVYTTLQKLSQPGNYEWIVMLANKFTEGLLFAVNIQNLYCFQYTSSNEELSKTAGWNYFTLEAEFRRQRVPNEEWALCNLNRNYELCDTCMWLSWCLLSIFYYCSSFEFQIHGKFMYQQRLRPPC